MGNGPMTLSACRVWNLTFPWDKKLAPVIESLSRHPIAKLNDSEVSPLWRVAAYSFEQVDRAMELWISIHGVEDGDRAALETCARRYTASFDRLAESVNKACTVGSMSKGETVLLQPLLMTDVERLRLSLALVGSGQMSGNTSSRIAEGAALLYLNNYLSQIAILAMAIRSDCARPMGRLSKKQCMSIRFMPLLSSYYAKMRMVYKALSAIGAAISYYRVHDFMIKSRLLSGHSRIVVNSVVHAINNRLTPSIGLLQLLMGNTEMLIEGDGRGYSGLDGLLEDWEKMPNDMAHVAISDDEPIIHVGKRHRKVELISEGHPPPYINVTSLDMITDHFVDNAINHTDDPSGITLWQAPNGVHVTDRGTGISLDRLRTIERQVRVGNAVLSDREGGGGSGVRDSVALLGKLFNYCGSLNDNAGDRRAAITIASKQGDGTISSITWGDAFDEVELDVVPEGWHYVQFVLESEGGKVAERSGNDCLPRPITDIFLKYDRFGRKEVGIHG